MKKIRTLTNATTEIQGLKIKKLGAFSGGLAGGLLAFTWKARETALAKKPCAGRWCKRTVEALG